MAPNPRIAALIAEKLHTGLPHPGDPDDNQPPLLIPLPGFRAAGLPPEYVEHARSAAKLIGEALVNVIETEGESEIVSKTELERIRAADTRPHQPTPIACAQCGNPILHANTHNGRITLPPAALRRLNPACPHDTTAN